MAEWGIQVLNGISFGMLLFLLASGLTVIMGLMGVINLAHGSFYLLGAYFGLTALDKTNNFLVALVVAAVGVGLVGLLVQRLLVFKVRQTESRLTEELFQVLLTLGIVFAVADIALWVWGGSPTALQKPAFLQSSLEIGTVVYPWYRLFVIGVGLVIALLLWQLVERTKMGAVVRAGVDDEEMVRGLGINMPLVFSAVFALGAALAGIGGVLGGVMIGVGPLVDFQVLLLAMVVVIVGGIGSLRGALIGSVLVGLVDTFGKALVPEFALVTVYLPMAVMLVFKPRGLFGTA